MRMDSPWSLPEVLGKLIEATEHLLDGHSCDAHGHELYRAAANAGRSILREWQDSVPNAPARPLRCLERAQLARDVGPERCVRDVGHHGPHAFNNDSYMEAKNAAAALRGESSSGETGAKS